MTRETKRLLIAAAAYATAPIWSLPIAIGAMLLTGLFVDSITEAELMEQYSGLVGLCQGFTVGWYWFGGRA